MKVLVITGSREGHLYLRRVLSSTHKEEPIDLLVLGCAKGVDSQALSWALKNDVFFVVFSANWGRYGNSAGPKRNERMIECGCQFSEVQVVGFPLQGKSKGTYHCMDYAKSRGLQVFEIDGNGVFRYY